MQNIAKLIIIVYHLALGEDNDFRMLVITMNFLLQLGVLGFIVVSYYNEKLLKYMTTIVIIISMSTYFRICDFEGL